MVSALLQAYLRFHYAGRAPESLRVGSRKPSFATFSSEARIFYFLMIWGIVLLWFLSPYYGSA